jgi:mevalonate kinase
MSRRTETFYAKILLFGEYSILCNSMGLIIPYSHFKGELSFINEDKYTDHNFAVRSNKLLGEFHAWLAGEGLSPEFSSLLQLELLAQDIQQGLYFESTIPQGYGIGSSGALVAAIYAWYATNRIQNTTRISKGRIQELLALFSYMEDFFHGQSSGIDPLNSYLKHPLLIRSREDISLVGIPRDDQNIRGAIFLIDTGKAEKTGPLVSHFLEQLKHPDYANDIREKLIPFNDNCINAIIKGEQDILFTNLRHLSEFTLTHFKRMIPESIKELWLQGLKTDHFYLKLCGSGGGGFLLGFTKDYEKAKAQLASLQIGIIPVYMSNRTI